MWRTFLLVYVIMASGGATGGAEGGTTDYEMTQESSRSEVCRSKPTIRYLYHENIS